MRILELTLLFLQLGLREVLNIYSKVRSMKLLIKVLAICFKGSRFYKFSFEASWEILWANFHLETLICIFHKYVLLRPPLIGLFVSFSFLPLLSLPEFTGLLLFSCRLFEVFSLLLLNLLPRHLLGLMVLQSMELSLFTQAFAVFVLTAFSSVLWVFFFQPS